MRQAAVTFATQTELLPVPHLSTTLTGGELGQL